MSQNKIDASAKSTEILIDSEKRNNYASTNAASCVVASRNIIEEGEYALINGFITNSNYTIDSSTNVLRFNDGSVRSATITAGYYSGNTIAAAVQTALAASGTGLTFTVSFSTATSKLTISATAAFSIYDMASDSSSTAAPILGVVSASSTSNSITCSRPINLAYNSLGYLISVAESPTSSIDLNSATADFHFYIPCSVNYGEVVTFQDYHANKIIKINRSGAVTVTVKNTHGRTIDLQNGGWQLLLRRIYPC
jgi:hypothetical protein